MNLGIVGYRKYTDYEEFQEVLKKRVDVLKKQLGELASIITGDATGADAMARRYAAENNIPLVVKVADWQKYGNGAGPKRNQLIIDECTGLIAFLSLKSKGTYDSIARARKKGIPVQIFKIDRPAGQSMALETANGEYSYDMEFFGRTLQDWVQGAHEHNCRQLSWRVTPLKPGMFGFDNLAVSLGHIFTTVDVFMMLETGDIEYVSSAIHDGWAKNYSFWRDMAPHKSCKEYMGPAKPLGDARRNSLALMPYHELPEDEKEKDRIIARYVLQQLK
jgi:hypothetical protein